MTKFKIVEIKQKQKVQEKEEGGNLRRGLDALAHTLHFVLGVNTSLISSMEGVWDVWKRWKEGLKKVKQKPEEQALLYLAKDKEGMKLLKKYIFEANGTDTTPLFGLIETNEYPSGSPITAQCYLMQSAAAGFVAEDGNDFLTKLDAATRVTTSAAVFDGLASKFSLTKDIIAQLVEQYFKGAVKQITQNKLLNIKGVQKELKRKGASINPTDYGKILDAFINEFI